MTDSSTHLYSPGLVGIIATESSVSNINGKKGILSYRGYSIEELAQKSTFEETSCISLLECMAAGLYCITTDFGALFETGAEFPMYIPYSKDYKSLSRKFAHGIEAAAISLEDDTINDHLRFQID